VDNNQQAWILIDYLVSKLLEDKSVKALDKPSFKLTDPIASFLGLIYVNDKQRVSSKQAVLIREHLHLKTLQDLCNVEYEDLVGIKGIGSKTARKIMECIK
jgi:DNA integrity scanning protein DisA with diadenylate cyclase activity